ncbi:MAG: hypothetical protein CV089_22110 [Nitrospira sp. WS110]|nr:hypothetical protein [Nitrospira sp. WS110]
MTRPDYPIAHSAATSESAGSVVCLFSMALTIPPYTLAAAADQAGLNGSPRNAASAAFFYSARSLLHSFSIISCLMGPSFVTRCSWTTDPMNEQA